MSWLETILVGAVALSALMWAGLTIYILGVQRRRETTRATLASTLAALERVSNAEPADRLNAVRPLLAAASRELVMHAASDRELSKEAFETLAGLLEERWTIDSLVRDAASLTSGRDRWRRITALRSLSRLDHPAVLDLLARAIDDVDADVAACGLALLGQSQDSRAVDLLINALSSPRLSASRVAVYIDQSPQDLGAMLSARLSDTNPVVRQWSATLLARYPDEPVAEKLAELTSDSDPRVRKAAIQTLGRVGGDDAVDCAVRLLTDSASFVRAYAARALGELGRTDQAERVAALLGDGDWWVRLAARESLEMMGPEVWPVMIRCLEHRDKFVRNGAAEVVQNLGVLDSLIMLEAASDNPASAKVAMLRRIASAGGARFTESLVERAGPVVGPRVRQLLDTMGLERVGAA